MTTEIYCNTCGGNHIPDPQDCHVDFQGFRFTPPFRCMCCGEEICVRQFAFARACGSCDVGSCNSMHKSFKVERAHPHPEWWSGNPAIFRARYVRAVNATSLDDVVGVV